MIIMIQPDNMRQPTSSAVSFNRKTVILNTTLQKAWLRFNQVWFRMGGFGLMALVLSGCGQLDQTVEQPPVQVSFMTVTSKVVEIFEDLPGRVAPLRIAEIRPQISGIVQKRLFEQGAEIAAGQALFQINAAPFQADVDMAEAALKKAEAALAQARQQMNRLEPLVKVEAVSRQVFDDAVSRCDQAAADQAQAAATLARRQIDLKFATVEAPISGRIDQALVTEGALVGPADSSPMARIQRLDQVYIDVRQPASSLDNIRESLPKREIATSNGLPVSVLRGDGTLYDLAGRILFSGVNVDASTGDVLLRVLVDNPHRQLLPGMFVRVRIPRARYADALMVPQQSVLRVGGQPQLWVLDVDNQAHAAPVELGEMVNRYYRVRSGLNAGQRIVVEGMERLVEGAKVAPSDWQVATTDDRSSTH